MRIRGLGRIRIGAEKILGRIRPGVVILLYHRVIDLPSDPLLLCVTPEHFAEHLEVIARFNRQLKLRELSASLRNRKVPTGSIVVTFDDGAKDNLYNAKPLLERHGIPATVFVASGYTGTGRELWWDELDRLLLAPEDLPEKLTLTINGSIFEWEFSHIKEQTQSGDDNRWSVLKDAAPGSRNGLYRSLHQLLRPLSPERRNDVIEQLRAWSGRGAVGRRTHETLSADEIRELEKDGLVEIGAHTVWHPVLASLPEVEQTAEIVQSKSDLERIVEQPIRSFAYPYGTLADYNRGTVNIVRNAGFECACSNYTGVIHGWTNRFELPRFVVQDWDGDTFESKLRGWFHG